MSFILSTDTSCDIFKDELTARKIEYRSLIFTIDGVEHVDDYSGDQVYRDFYTLIDAGKMPTTSQINITEHEEYFKALFDKYEDDIVHITLSSGLSSTYASACMAAKNVEEETGRKVYVVDSLGATVAHRHIVDHAEKLRDAGVSGAEAKTVLEEYRNHIHTWFMPTDLMHLKRGGRVSGPAAVIGTALNIKPILYINKVGGLSVVYKKIGVPKGMAAMADIFKRDIAEAASKVYIPTAGSEYAEEMQKKIKTIRPDCDVEIGWIGPVIGAHTGRGATGVSFYSDKVRDL